MKPLWYLMVRLHLLRHAESVANVQKVLASQLDFPLSPQGKHDAKALAAQFSSMHQVRRIYSSPLIRALQTAVPFVTACDAPLTLDSRLMEQNLGRFAGLGHLEAESDPAYVTERTQRWHWVPEGGGESYERISFRVREFLFHLLLQPETPVLVVTHAVTLRLFRAVLEGTLPFYPETIPGNGEMWVCDWNGLPTTVTGVDLQQAPRVHGE